MNMAGLTYSEPGEVAEYLMSANDVSLSDVVGALANAMTRIAALEAALALARAERAAKDARDAARSAANTAACLANGIKPD